MYNPTVLVVDDIPENIDILVSILQEKFEVIATVKSEYVVKVAIEKQPDIILLDIMMPEIDGYEVLKNLKNRLDTAHIPVIFITAKQDFEDEAKGYSMGAADYVTKPINPIDLIARIKRQLSLKP